MWNYKTLILDEKTSRVVAAFTACLNEQINIWMSL